MYINFLSIIFINYSNNIVNSFIDFELKNSFSIVIALLLTMRYLILLFFIVSCSYEKYESSDQPPLAGECTNGFSTYTINGEDVQFECNDYDLVGYVSLDQMDANSGNDCWVGQTH